MSKFIGVKMVEAGPMTASEALQKLKDIRPTSIEQASRISGENPADISILTVYLKKENRI